MTAAQAADELNIDKTTLLRWEKRGWIPKPPRVKGQRYFTKDALEEIKKLRLMRKIFS